MTHLLQQAACLTGFLACLLIDVVLLLSTAMALATLLARLRSKKKYFLRASGDRTLVVDEYGSPLQIEGPWQEEAGT